MRTISCLMLILTSVSCSSQELDARRPSSWISNGKSLELPYDSVPSRMIANSTGRCLIIASRRAGVTSLHINRVDESSATKWHRVATLSDKVTSIACNGSFIATGSMDGNISCFTLEGAVRWKVKAMSQFVVALHFDGDTLFVSGVESGGVSDWGDNGVVKTFSVESGDLIGSLKTSGVIMSFGGVFASHGLVAVRYSNALVSENNQPLVAITSSPLSLKPLASPCVSTNTLLSVRDKEPVIFVSDDKLRLGIAVDNRILIITEKIDECGLEVTLPNDVQARAIFLLNNSNAILAITDTNVFKYDSNGENPSSVPLVGVSAEESVLLQHENGFMLVAPESQQCAAKVFVGR